MKLKIIVVFIILTFSLKAQVNWNKILIENDLRNIQNKELTIDSVKAIHQSFLNVKLPEILNESKVLLDSVISDDWYVGTKGSYWNTSYRTWYKYDEIGNMVERNMMAGFPGATLNLFSFFYDSLKRINAWNHKFFDDNIWFEKQNVFIGYNDKNTTSDTVHQKWIDSSKTWINDYKSALEYNQNGNIVLQTGYNWVNDNWSNLIKNVYEYDQDFLMSETYCEWYGYWFEETTLLYQYDEKGNKIIGKNYFNDGRNNSLIAIYIYYYDSLNNLIKFEWYSVSDDSVLRLITIDEYFYNDKNLISELKTLFRHGSGFRNSSRELYKYDDYNNLVEVIGQNGNEKDTLWENNWRALFYYSKLLYTKDGIKEDEEIVVYPNPSSNQITININSEIYSQSKIEIYNLIGIKQFEYEIEFNTRENSIQIDVSSFLTGVYNIVLNYGTEVKKTMIVKE